MTRLILCALCVLCGKISAADLFDENAATTVFAFDNVSIPHTQNLRLEMRSPAKHSANPVVPRGQAGTPDAKGVQFYGSVIREGGKFRMWYVAFDDDTENKVASSRWRAAYAESDDGVNWIKPNLGLVEYHGNKNNNLILTDPAPLGFVNVKVLADPADPNPARRYKISGQARPFAAGMIMTVEPGLYVSPGTEGADQKYWGIGVRIEDDVLVTERGPRVLTAGVPKQVSEIEALMK